MRILKNKAFDKWAHREGLRDDLLRAAVDEMERGLFDVSLGGHVFKKRISLRQQGKSGGVRTVVAYRKESVVFFIYGFAKNKQANISRDELKALKRYAAELLDYSESELRKAVLAAELIEVQCNG